MNQPNTGHTRRELRKELIRLRMEMHRQEIRQETTNLMQPLRRMQGMKDNWHESLGVKHGPLWAVAGVSLLGFLTAKGSKNGIFGRILKLGTTLTPLIKLALINSAAKKRGGL